MIGALRSPTEQLVTVFGGSGFIGRVVVNALAQRGYRILVASRRPDLANHLQPLGSVGQIHAIQANLRDAASVARAVERADHVVNLVGILQEKGRQSFDALQSNGPKFIADAARKDARIIHVSALGASAQSPSAYGRSKGEGETALFSKRPDAIVLRPSVVFGPGDSFLTRFATLVRMLPVIPLAGSETRFQPVYVGDVAQAVVRGVEGHAEGGKVYELGGPEILTLRAIVDYVLEITERRRLILPLPWPVAKAQGTLLGCLDRATFGLIPDELVITKDQVTLLQNDNVVSEGAVREGRTLLGLGISPTAMEAIVPHYLMRFREKGQFDLKRNTGTRT